MINRAKIPSDLLALLEKNVKHWDGDLTIPAPSFEAMQGEMIDYNIDSSQSTLTAKFPILPEQLNPYGGMQGGFVAAAIDNTIGPLSMLVAPPNVTRYITIKYGKSATLDTQAIWVQASFKEQKKRQLFFEATVRDGDNNKLASAQATHWIVG